MGDESKLVGNLNKLSTDPYPSDMLDWLLACATYNSKGSVLHLYGMDACGCGVPCTSPHTEGDALIEEKVHNIVNHAHHDLR